MKTTDTLNPDLPSNTGSLVWDQEAVGPNPIAPIQENKGFHDPSSLPEKNPGIHPGHYPARDKWGHRLSDRPVRCENCSKEFFPSAKDARRRTVRFCSNQCRHQARKGHTPAPVERFITPPSTKAERIRANGLVNMRERRGWFVPPKKCQKCSGTGKLDKHHPDYSKPDQVYFLCRSCHMRTHQDPAFLAGVDPLKLNNRPTYVPHGRGGRRGPTGKAVGRHPLVRIIETVSILDSVTEFLSCGHEHNRVDNGLRPVQRRCQQCPRVSPSLPAPAAPAGNGGGR